MTERELLALMAATLYATENDRGYATRTQKAIYSAELILSAVDERLQLRGTSPQSGVPSDQPGEEHG